MNSFVPDFTNFELHCAIGDSVSGEIIITAENPVETNTAADYVVIKQLTEAEGYLIEVTDEPVNITEGSVTLPYNVICDETLGEGVQNLEVEIINLGDPRTRVVVNMEVTTILPDVLITELSTEEWNNLDEVTLTVFGNHFFDGTRLFLDEQELPIDIRTRHSIQTTIPAGTTAGVRTLKVEGAGGSLAETEVEILEPGYIVKVYQTNTSLVADEEFSFAFEVLGMNRFNNVASFNITNAIEEWNVSIEDPFLTDGQTGLLTGRVPLGTEEGEYSFNLEADSGASVVYTINVTDSYPEPVIKGLSDESLFAGESFEIYGYGFKDSGEVYLDDTKLNIIEYNSTLITVMLPKSAENGMLTIQRDGITSNAVNVYVKYKGLIFILLLMKLPCRQKTKGLWTWP